MKNFSAIDIGSNAIRLIIVDEQQNLLFKKRFPLRLGSDVFLKNSISPEKEQQISFIFSEIKEHFTQWDIADYRAVATSAFRDAKNGIEISHKIKSKYNFKIDIISGLEEADHIFKALKNRGHLKSKKYLLVDIGGGSLELSITKDNKILNSKSIDVGTLRLLKNIKTGRLIDEYHTMLSMINSQLNLWDLSGIKTLLGTGGSFRRIAKLRKKILTSSIEPEMQKEEISMILGLLMNYSEEEITDIFEVKPEQAPVLIPALLIIQRILANSNIHEIKTPKVSLNYGVLDQLIP